MINYNENKDNLLKGQFFLNFQALWYITEKEHFHFQSHQKNIGYVSWNQSNLSPL